MAEGSDFAGPSGLVGGRDWIGPMSETDVIQRTERFTWIADAGTVRAARAALPVLDGMVVDDHTMAVTTGSSSRTIKGIESFLEAVSAGADSFSYGAISRKAAALRALAGVVIDSSSRGTSITVYAEDDETAASILNAIRAVQPTTRATNRTTQPITTQVRISIDELHPSVVHTASSLFKSGHYFQAEFEAFKSLETRVRELAGTDKSGVDLMSEAFRPTNPQIDTATETGRSGTAQREGFLALFRGAMLAVRDPRAHTPAQELDPRDTLEYLAFASLLHRRLDVATVSLSRPRT